MDLITRIQNIIESLNGYVKGLQNWGLKKANAERDYKTALSTEVLKERDKGTAVGIISLTVYGKPEVAKMRLERDIAEVMYQVSQEKINIAKLELRLLDSQAQREWSVSDGR